ncbi:MAG: hypothetical protein ACI4VE_03165 [Clostridia bacterium]
MIYRTPHKLQPNYQ